MKRLFATLLVLAGTATVASYTDDTLTHPTAIAPTRVNVTDDPFPFDKVSSVNIYVTRIEASRPGDRALTTRTIAVRS